MITVPARILPATPLMYKKNQVMPKSASWNMANRQFSDAKPVSDWAVLKLFLPSNHRENGQVNDVDEKIRAFQRTLQDCGLVTQSPGKFMKNLSLDEDQNDKTIQATLEDICKKPVRILLVILPTDNKHTYSRIKYWAEIKFGMWDWCVDGLRSAMLMEVNLGIHTVCSIAKKLDPPNDRALNQYFANIGLKFNLKMGGTNQSIAGEKLGIVKDSMTMLVGIDVTHPSPSSLKGTPSIAGVVASIDHKLAQWPGSIRAQESRKEMVSHLEAMMVERLQSWQKKNGRKLPNKILVYRDGVSESQYKTVLNEEYPCLRKAYERVYPSNTAKPKISLIIVGKRHHTRFFPMKKDKPDADEKGNPVNGMIVDRGITMQNGWDFFLQAHTALQGTARPAHYVVIRNEIGLGVNGLETLVSHK